MGAVMTTTRDALERAQTTILEPLGVRALGREMKVRVDPGSDRFRIRLAMPAMYIDVDLEHEELLRADGQMRMLDKLDRHVKLLFTYVIDHIAKHDRSPIDRMKDIEGAATALLDAMSIHLDDVRMMHGSSSAVLNAAYRLRELVGAKPGAAAWGPNGYGRDQPEPEVKTAP